MNSSDKKYYLDANVLIQAWQKYYAPSICPTYWDILSDFGKVDKLFMHGLVYEEITRTEDDLSDWLKSSDIPIRKIDEDVTKCLQVIYNTNPNHKHLVDNTKNAQWPIRGLLHMQLKRVLLLLRKRKKSQL